MNYYSIEGEDNACRVFVLSSYEVIPTKDNVIVKFLSTNNGVTYELRPDEVFKSVDSIHKSITNKLSKALSSGYTIKISEDFERMYVSIGYETEDEFQMDRFTASKL